MDDLAVLGLPLQRPAHRDITCYETLAQLGLILCLRSVVVSTRWVVRLRTLSDSIGTEAGINKLYSSHFPLSAFLEKLCMLACLTGIELDVSHVAGEKNDDADLLSRWDDPTKPLPDKFQEDFRVECGLDRIWFFRSDARLFPPNTFLKWKPPRFPGFLWTLAFSRLGLLLHWTTASTFQPAELAVGLGIVKLTCKIG